MEGETIKFPPSGQKIAVARGSAGLRTQVCGAAATISNLAAATGGIGTGNFIDSTAK